MPQEILNNNEDLTQNEGVDKKDIEALNVLHDANPEEIKEITDDIETGIKKSPDLKAAIESGYENIIVENEKTVNNKVDENAGVEKTSNELETVETESKNSQVGEISVPVSINEIKVGDIVYSSIDNYNPKIEGDKNKKDELLAEVQKLRDSGSQLTHLGGKLNLVEGNGLENSKEEQVKLSEMIKEFYEENKQVIEKELSITDIRDLSPVDAVKLVSYITMSKLTYNYAQAITPGAEGNYYENMSDSEKLDYKKDYLVTSYLSKLYCLPGYEGYYTGVDSEGNGAINNSTMKEKGHALYNSVYDSLKAEDIKFLESTNDFNQISNKAQEYLNPTIAEMGYETDENGRIYSTNEKNEKVDITSIFAQVNNGQRELYASNGKLFISEGENDHISVSDMLKNGKGVCRNYAIANEKLFEALKSIQSPINNKLQNSALVFYTGNDSGDEKLIAIADSENGTNGHAWNAFITIDNNGQKHISQIDTTFADSSGTEGGKSVGGDEISKVKQIDYTFDRVLNYAADSLTENQIKQIEPALIEYIKTLDAKGDIAEATKMKEKLINIYRINQKSDKFDGVINSLKTSLGNNFENNTSERIKIINSLVYSGQKDDLKSALSLIGNVNESDIKGNILKIALLSSNFDEKNFYINLNKFFENNPDFANGNSEFRKQFLLKNGEEYGQYLINMGLLNYKKV